MFVFVDCFLRHSSGDTHDELRLVHPALRYLSEDALRGIRCISASNNGLFISCRTASDVQAVSDDLRGWDPEGCRYEHHVKDGGSVVVDWD